MPLFHFHNTTTQPLGHLWDYGVSECLESMLVQVGKIIQPYPYYVAWLCYPHHRFIALRRPISDRHSLLQVLCFLLWLGQNRFPQTLHFFCFFVGLCPSRWSALL
jgi:hypothetical protein